MENRVDSRSQPPREVQPVGHRPDTLQDSEGTQPAWGQLPTPLHLNMARREKYAFPNCEVKVPATPVGVRRLLRLRSSNGGTRQLRPLHSPGCCLLCRDVRRSGAYDVIDGLCHVLPIQQLVGTAPRGLRGCGVHRQLHVGKELGPRLQRDAVLAQ